MDFRKARPEDAKEIAGLEAAIFPDPWSEHSVLSHITSLGTTSYVVTEADRVIAYFLGRVIAPEGELYRIATHPSHRREGIAWRLLTYTVKCEMGRGLETLFLEVRAENAAARAFYRAFGFSEVGRRKNYYKIPPDDAVLMLFECGAVVHRGKRK